jgi:hypothetical protein
MKVLSKSGRRAARKLFPKVKQATRPFSKADYDVLPSIPNRPATK